MALSTPATTDVLLSRVVQDATEPLAGSISSVIVTVLTATILSTLITQRVLRVTDWRTLPPVAWIVFAIFLDSWLFVFATAILKFGVGLGASFGICQGAILLCLVCYVTTKLIYIFLVEKAYIIRQSSVPTGRLKSKLYIFNLFGMLGVYVVVSILNFIFRITRQHNGECIIGMQRIAMIPLISFDLLVNVYLTILFLMPLKNLHKVRHIQRNAANERLRTVAFRTFIGAVATTISSVVNLSVLMALDGEPGWVCLMCCNVDIAFSAIVVYWVTHKDRTPILTPSATSAYAKGCIPISPDSEHVGPRGPSSNGGGSSSNNKQQHPSHAVFARRMPQCLHECLPGTGCYYSSSADVGGSGSSSTQHHHAARPTMSLAQQAVAMYHYHHHHRHRNGGSSNRNPFTKSSSVSGGTFDSSSRALDEGRVSDFRKYGFAEGADSMTHVNWPDDEMGARSINGNEENEYELVLRKKQTPVTQPVLLAELDPVPSLPHKGSCTGRWSVAKETTLVVESTAVGEEMDGPNKSGGLRAVFGTTTVCRGGERHDNAKGGLRGKTTEAAYGGQPGGGKKGAAGYMEPPITGFFDGVGEEDSMWDGTQGNRAARIEALGGRRDSLSSTESLFDMRVNHV